MENNEKILKKLYETGTREVQPMELIPLKFNFNGLFTKQSVAFGVITYYFWKDVKYGEYLLERVEETGQTEDNDINILNNFLLNSDEGSYSTCKKYLESYPDTLLKWFQINKTQGGDSVAQWISWTELSLEEIDNA